MVLQSCNSQNNKTAKNDPSVIKIEDNFDSANSLLLYKYNPKNVCNQSKAVSVIKENKVSQCFDFVKNIDSSKTREILKILNDNSTYGNEDISCFDTDYSLVVMKGKTIIGYINFSFNCNKLISNPEIEARTAKSKDGLRKVGFSDSGKNKLLKLLGI